MSIANANSGQLDPERPPHLTAVVPCFDEEAALSECYRRLSAACQRTAKDSYEIVLVNDGSRDGTWGVIKALSETDPHVVGIDLAKNHGHQIALSAGLRFAQGERIVLLDADLQDPPELLDELMAQMDLTEADVIYGRRVDRAGESWYKRTSALLFYRCFSWLSGTEVPIDVGDFRLMTRRVVNVLNSMPEQHRFLRGMVPWVGFRQLPLDYRRAPRYAGTSHYPVVRMVRLAIDAVTSFSLVPLWIASCLGLAALGATVLFGILAITHAMFGHGISGSAILLLTVLFLGGAQLLTIGILGAYIGRIHQQAQSRPMFIVREIVRCNRPPRGPR